MPSMVRWNVDIEFQSPDGDFVYSDQLSRPSRPHHGVCFNPLTGISSILTKIVYGVNVLRVDVSIP